MVQDSGGVALSAKGVVIGLNAKSMDVVWDNMFMSGTTLGDRLAPILIYQLLSLSPQYLTKWRRCSQYRGSTVEFNTCLNLTNPQFVTSTNPKAPVVAPANPPFRPRFGPHPVIQPPPGQAAASGFRPAEFVSVSVHSGSFLILHNRQAPIHIMANPNRGRGGYVNGRGNSHNHNQHQHRHVAAAENGSAQQQQERERAASAQTNGVHHAPHATPVPAAAGRGFPRGGRGGVVPGYRGRGGGFVPVFERGRGVHHGRGGFRGRGRGAFAAPLAS